mmetsp:Transcript_88989/g.215876  ORF Transcript_88989/g.215876 Transcript_88989/m.215876 type:complete len:216 (-) Transcript_88989:331-978(-)
MLAQVAETLLGDDNVGLHLDDAGRDFLDVLLLEAQYFVPVRVLHNFDVGIRLPLLVLERTVKQQHARVTLAARHLGVRHIFVEHNAREHAALGQLATRDLLHLGVALDVDRRLADFVELSEPVRVARLLHAFNRRYGQVDHLVLKARHKLGPDARPHDGTQAIIFAFDHSDRHLAHDTQRKLQRLVVRPAHYRWVHVAVDERARHSEHLARQHNN